MKAVLEGQPAAVEVREAEDVVHPVEDEEVLEEVRAEGQGEVPKSSSSLTGILVFLLPKAKSICSSLKISYPANPCMVKSAFQ